MSDTADVQAAKTPVINLLRAVPADARMMYEHSPTSYSNIPVGHLAAEAADLIESQQRTIAETVEKLHRLVCPDNDYGLLLPAERPYQDLIRAILSELEGKP